MEIAKNTVVSLTYALEVEGELIERTDKDNPLVFLVGTGSMIPGFEHQLLGKQKGDTYKITIPPEDGYGESDPEAVVELSKDIFKIDGLLQEDMLEEGKVVPMQDQNGQPLQGIVVEVGEDNVKMDFNHRLAGKTLDFTGEILDVRAATSEEISHGHVHGEGGHHH
jgi:FKBP-type peptidyl-prolyl cis-trans isomerase SlyD